MSHVYMGSDWHFGHHGILRWRTQFNTIDAMEDKIMENALAVLNKRDVLYLLGDIAFDMRGLEKLHKIPCRKILVRGNHDCHLSTHQLLTVFDSVEGAVKYKKYWLTHIPVHPCELYRGKNIHGHCHRGGPFEQQVGDDWWKYFNLVPELNDYKLLKMQDIGVTFAKREEQFG